MARKRYSAEQIISHLRQAEIFTTLKEAKVLTEVWRREYNQVRPHSSLGYKPPTLGPLIGAMSLLDNRLGLVASFSL